MWRMEACSIAFRVSTTLTTRLVLPLATTIFMPMRACLPCIRAIRKCGWSCVMGSRKGEKMKKWKGENMKKGEKVKEWKGEKMRKWKGENMKRGEKVKGWKGEKMRRWKVENMKKGEKVKGWKGEKMRKWKVEKMVWLGVPYVLLSKMLVFLPGTKDWKVIKHRCQKFMLCVFSHMTLCSSVKKLLFFW